MAKKINYEAMAKEIYEWCKARELWGDCCIYFNLKALASWKEWSGEKGVEIADGLYEYDRKDPREYFEWGNPFTLSMSFEGNLYGVFNYYWEDAILSKWHDEFYQMIEKYDCFFELGNSWNLTIVED